MTAPLLFKGGRIAAEDRPDLIEADVLVENGRIAAVAPGLPAPAGAEVRDVGGKILVPAMFDVHVHLREPGREDKETIESGSKAALNGGVTGILAMPNTEPPIDSGGMVRFVRNLARDRAVVPVWTSGCITKGRKGESLAEIADMREQGAVMFTDDGSPVSNPQVLRRALEYARTFGAILASHCETMELSGDGAMNEGRMSYRLGVPGVPACSEEICIDRDLALARVARGRIHIQHVSSARGMEIIRRYKEDGVQVTCEVSPHHLLFCDEDIADFDTHYKMNPPLRTREDNARLLEGLKEGLFDVIATDHAPHTRFEKDRDFREAPFGITGLETALISLYDRFIRADAFGWDLLVRRYSAEPRRLLGFDPVPIAEGGAAEFLVFDPEAVTRVDETFMRSLSINTPFLNRELRGSVEQVVRDGQVVLDRPAGVVP